MKLLRTILSPLAIIVTILSFQACFDEDMSDCPSGVKIYFDFTRGTYASAKEGINPDDIDMFNLFVFDTTNVLVNTYLVEDIEFSEEFYIEINDLPDGDYRMVAWGGLKDDYSLQGTVVPGVTTMGNLQVYLNTINATNQTVAKQITPLFFANKEGYIRVINSLDVEDKLSLVQNSYKINVTVEGLDTTDDYQLTIQDDAGMMNFDNSIISVGNFNYVTACEKANNNLKGSLSLLRMMENRRTPVLRLNRTNEQTALFERDLVEMILLINTIGGKIDFSYMHEFDIELSTVGGLDFTIRINGWTVHEESRDLEP